jgi:hypothetical protein
MLNKKRFVRHHQSSPSVVARPWYFMGRDHGSFPCLAKFFFFWLFPSPAQVGLAGVGLEWAECERRPLCGEQVEWAHQWLGLKWRVRIGQLCQIWMGLFPSPAQVGLARVGLEWAERERRPLCGEQVEWAHQRWGLEWRVSKDRTVRPDMNGLDKKKSEILPFYY